MVDVNNTRYHLLLGKSDWATCALDPDGIPRVGDTWPLHSAPTGPLAWDGAREELVLTSRAFRFIAPSRAVSPTPEDRRGAGRDRFGSWYWIDDAGQELLVNSSGSGTTTHFWSTADEVTCEPDPHYGEFGPRASTPPPAPLKLQGLAITDDQLLVVGVLQPAGVLVFDLYEGGPPRQMVFPKEVPFQPFDMAPRPGGGVWVLDRENRRYWAFDAHINVVPRDQAIVTLESGGMDDFQPRGAVEPARTRVARSMPGGIDLEAAAPLDIHDPISIENLPDGSVLVLDRDPQARSSRITHLRFGQREGASLDTSAMDVFLETQETGDLLRGHDIAFVPGTSAAPVHQRRLLGQLYVASASGNQSIAFNLFEVNHGLSLEPLSLYLPMRLFGGKAVVAAGDQVYYDFADRWVPLVEQERQRHVADATLYTPIEPGTPVFDGRDPDCVWHRLAIDACLPHGAELWIESRTANDLPDLRFAEWRAEPRPATRSDGTELPYVTRRGPYDTLELLFQRARGRFLQLKLTLRGNGQTTPHIRALRAYFPRFSYLTHYLPAVYQEDASSASFLDRFLANFEGTLTGIEDRIAAAQVLFDPYTAPDEALEWLVSWFAVALDPAWSEIRRRLFIRYAMLFFRQRGTLNGLYMALQIAFGDCDDERLFTTGLANRGSITAIRIIESFRTRRTPGVVLGDPTDPARLRPVNRRARWIPSEGGTQLQARYAEFVATQDTATKFTTPFRLTPPTSPVELAAWTQFCLDVLGFVPSIDKLDLPAWHAFLARRYVSLEALNDSYGLKGTARHARYDDVGHPSAVPHDGPALQDWFKFQAVVLPMRRSAHHFVVLLPVPRTGQLSDDERRDRLSLAQRVVELEKPAHTTFDVRLFWAMFRVGQARLGIDTLVERGSRSPELMTPMILGQGHVMESYLSTANVPPPRRWSVAGDQR